MLSDLVSRLHSEIADSSCVSRAEIRLDHDRRRVLKTKVDQSRSQQRDLGTGLAFLSTITGHGLV